VVVTVRCKPRMNTENRRRLADRIARAAEASLAAQNYVSSVDVLVGIGWLDPGAVKRWRQGQVDYLERVVQTNLSRISEAMKLFRSWATAKGLIPSETSYVARTPSRQTLRFSKSGSPTIERLYRTHWLSSELSQRKQERLVEKASRAPETAQNLSAHQRDLMKLVVRKVASSPFDACTRTRIVTRLSWPTTVLVYSRTSRGRFQASLVRSFFSPCGRT
jgi:hypothetical protein